jgi:hypothetical protein
LDFSLRGTKGMSKGVVHRDLKGSNPLSFTQTIKQIQLAYHRPVGYIWCQCKLWSFWYRKSRNKKLRYLEYPLKHNLVIHIVCCRRRTCNYCSAGMFTKKHKGYKLYLINLLWKILQAKTKFLAHMENLSLASIGLELDGKFHVFLRDPEIHSNTPPYCHILSLASWIRATFSRLSCLSIA